MFKPYNWVFLLFAPMVLAAQQDLGMAVDLDQDTTEYTWVDQMPVFAGCDAADTQADVCSARELTLYLYQNLRYPAEALARQQGGKILLRILIGKRGEVKRVLVEESSGVPALDREGIRLAQAMPRWTPGHIGDRAVQVELAIPVFFAPEMFARD